MKTYVRCLIVIIGVLFLATGCEDLIANMSQVRFRNDSASKTVSPIWDGIKMATLAPGEKTKYRSVNPGSHTIQWKDSASNKALTSIAWPNLVKGISSTFPYTD